MALPLQKLEPLLQNLSSTHSEILKAKYRSQRICDLKNEEEVAVALLEVVRYACSITGWKMPLANAEQDFYQTLGYKLKNNYKELSIAELKLAFMQYCSSIKNYYDKPISLPVIDEVIGLYLIDRDAAVELEQDFIDKMPKEQILDLVAIKNNSKFLIQSDYEMFLKGEYDPLNSLSSHIYYDTLVADNYFGPGVSDEFLSIGLYQLKKRYAKVLDNENLLPNTSQQEKNIKDRRVKEARQNIGFLAQIENEAKKYAVKALFIKAQKEGMKNIYIKVDE